MLDERFWENRSSGFKDFSFLPLCVRYMIENISFPTHKFFFLLFFLSYLILLLETHIFYVVLNFFLKKKKKYIYIYIYWIGQSLCWIRAKTKLKNVSTSLEAFWILKEEASYCRTRDVRRLKKKNSSYKRYWSKFVWQSGNEFDRKRKPKQKRM